MFGFLDMMDNYKDRKVNNTEIGEAVIDTCSVTDSEQPFETGICHPRYNNNSWVIVEMYNSKEEAVLGHKKWVSAFEDGKLPPHLEDVSTCKIAKLFKDSENSDVYELSAGN